MTTLRKSAFLISAAALIGGCVTNPVNVLDNAIYETKCLGSDNKEQCVAQARAEAEASMARQRQNQNRTSSGKSYVDCKWFNYAATGPANVDLAYARAKATHRWRTYDERTKNGRDEWIDAGFRHSASPGAIYDMQDYAWFSPAELEGVWSSLKLVRTTKGTSLTARVCLYPNEVKYLSTIQKELKAIVR